MAFPIKPFEANIRMQRAPSTSGLLPQSSSSSAPGVRIPAISTVPPPLPPRQHMNSLSYTGPGYGPVNSYSMYGGYGGYGGGYSGYNGLGGLGLGNFGHGGNYGMLSRGGYNGRSIDDMENRFIQMAQDSSRPAFESVESIVRTFASVTMMLESTFHAMQTSFYAVLGVAENFDRLRKLSVQVAKYVSALAMIRTIYWFYRRILYMLGLIKTHPSSETVWNAVENSIISPVKNSQQENVIQSAWPIVTFFGLLFGGPFVVYKLISSIKGSEKDGNVSEENWDPRVHESEEVVVLYRFRAANEKELSVEPGERIKIPSAKYIKDNSGWLMAVNQNNRVGLVPMNYLGRFKKTNPLLNVPKTVPGKCIGGKENSSSVIFNAMNKTNDDENQKRESGEPDCNVLPVLVNVDAESSSSEHNKKAKNN